MIRYFDTQARILTVDRPTVVFSLDLETDYASGNYRGLKGVTPLLELFSKYNVGLTIFVEGKLLVDHPELILDLEERGVDLQIHCRDHQVDGGDTPELLYESTGLFEDLLGRRPIGYRGNTFNIDNSLLVSLQNIGFAYDSSLLPARFGFGANPDGNWRRHDCAFHLDKYGLVEFPVATIWGIGAPFIHSYTCLAQLLSLGHFLKVAPMPQLLIYDMHMVDLVCCLDSLPEASIPRSAKRIYAKMWPKGRQDTFDILEELIIRLKNKCYRFITLTQLYRELCD